MIELNDAICIICELAAEELFDRLDAVTAFSERDCKLVSAQIASAVSYLHLHHKVAHRDIKSANILCAHQNTTESGCIKLADLGFAVEFNEPRKSEFVDNCGTLEYYAPELCENMLARLRGEETIFYSPSVDCWSFGCVLYELLCGQPPFWSDDDVEQIHLILRCRLEFPDDPFAQVSDEAKSLIRGLLRPDQERRLTMAETLRHPWFARECRSTSEEEDDESNLRASPIESRLFPNLVGSETKANRGKTRGRRKSQVYQERFARGGRQSINEAFDVDQFVQDAHSGLKLDVNEEDIDSHKIRQQKSEYGVLRGPVRPRKPSQESMMSEGSDSYAFSEAEGATEAWKGPFARRSSAMLISDVQQALTVLSVADGLVQSDVKQAEGNE